MTNVDTTDVENDMRDFDKADIEGKLWMIFTKVLLLESRNENERNTREKAI